MINPYRHNKETKMKISKILNEVKLPATFESFMDLMNTAIDENDYNTFRGLIKSTAQKQKFDWIGRFYTTKDSDGNLSKQVLKALNF